MHGIRVKMVTIQSAKSEKRENYICRENFHISAPHPAIRNTIHFPHANAKSSHVYFIYVYFVCAVCGGVR